MEEEMKKARGRPRKYPVDLEPKEKRPRGRPKKEVTEADLDKPKRPRGRPKKEVDLTAENKPKRARGRPRKAEIAPESENLAEKALNSENVAEKVTLSSAVNAAAAETEVLAQNVQNDEVAILEEEESAAQDFTVESVSAQIAENGEVQSLAHADFDEAENLFDEETLDFGDAEDLVEYDDENFDAESLNDIDAIEPRERKSIKDTTEPKIAQKANFIPAKHLKSEQVLTYEQKEQALQAVFAPEAEQKLNISVPNKPFADVNRKSKPIVKTKNTNRTKVVVVTGATSGLGLAMAKNLAGLGQVVIGIGRRPSACRDARNEILSVYPNTNVHYLVADLSLMGQVRILADEIKQKVYDLGYDVIDVLIHNAGIQTNVHKVTYENNEVMWATNYLAAFLLTKELQPLLDASRDARVILTTSDGARKAKLDWQNIRSLTPKSNDDVYHQTKLADLMFALEYDHKYADRGDLHAYCVNPGRVNTELRTKNTSGIKKIFSKFGKHKAKSIEQGIETTMYLCLAERLPKNMVFYENKKPAEPSKFAIDPRNRKALWRYTELELQD